MVGRHNYTATPAAFDPQLHMDNINSFWDSRVGATVALLTDLPSSGVPTGYPIWVQQVAALYIWNGTSWQTLSGSLGNILLNGGFDIWQRGLGQTTAFTAAAYTADQWKLVTATAVSTSALTESVGAFSTYGYKILATATTNAFGLAQTLESMTVNRLRGKYVTFGIDLQMSTGTQSVTISLQKAATADSSGASFSNIATNTVTATTTRTRVYVSGFVPADSSSAGLRVLVSGSNMANGAFVILRAAQLEEGQFANSFRPNASNNAAELVACSRHYVRWSAGQYISSGLVGGCTTVNTFLSNMPISMRATPQLAPETANVGVWNPSGAGVVGGGTFSLSTYTTASLASFQYVHTANTFVAGSIGMLNTPSAAGMVIALTAEL